MGLEQIVHLTHHGEDVLNVLRNRATPPSGPVLRHTMDTLLAVHDQLSKMIGDVRQGVTRVHDLGSLIARLGELRMDLERPEPEHPMLGEIMVVDHGVSRSEINESLAEAAWDGRKLGEVLVDKNLATPGQIKEALGKQTAPIAKDNTRTIRVDTAKLDELLNLVGELVLERNRLTRLTSDFRN